MNQHVRWPAQRFYWAALEAPNWRRTGVLPLGLRPAFEDEVPAPGEDLHAVCTPLGDGRIVVCAARRDELARLAPGTLSLCPESLPPGLDAPMDLSALNLLVGAFEPPAHRRARARRHITAALGVMLCCLLLAAGLVRRAEHQRHLAAEARSAAAALLAQVAPQARPEALTFELAALRRLAEQNQRTRLPPDVSLPLAELLRNWPAGVPARPQSLAIGSSGLTMAVLVDGDPVPFLQALEAPSGWMFDQPRLTKVDSMTRLDLRFRPSEGARP
jgi:hypothetical protein